MTITDIFKKLHTIAVVGLSGDPLRPSHSVSKYMQTQGYRIIPINPSEESVLGEPCFPSLEDVAESIDIVDVFRRSEYVPGIVESAIAIEAKVIWLQEGVFHEAAAELGRKAGLTVVEDRCILKEHMKL